MVQERILESHSEGEKHRHQRWIKGGNCIGEKMRRGNRSDQIWKGWKERKLGERTEIDGMHSWENPEI